MPGRVLIIDDEQNIRKTMEMIHRNAGWDTASASGGDEALEILQRERFDVVYLDIVMPGRDGLEILKEIKLRWQEIKKSSNSVQNIRRKRSANKILR